MKREDKKRRGVRHIGAMIGRIHCIHRQRLDTASISIGMQPGYRRLHYELIQDDGCTQRDLADRTGLSAPTVSIALGKMEKDGLISRKTDPDDSRKIRVYLTEKGTALDRAMREMLKENEERLTSCLDPDEKEELRRLLEKLLDTLQREGDLKSDEK